MIQRAYYNTDTLKVTIAVYEEHYRMSSSDFYDAHVQDAAAVRMMPGYHRHIWASMHRELHELCDPDGLPRRIERELELALLR